MQVEQAEREQNFQKTVTILGWGLAATSITASISAQFPYVVTPVNIYSKKETQKASSKNIIQLLQPKPFPDWQAPTTSLLFRLGVGVIFIVLAWLWLKLTKNKN